MTGTNKLQELEIRIQELKREIAEVKSQKQDRKTRDRLADLHHRLGNNRAWLRILAAADAALQVDWRSNSSRRGGRLAVVSGPIIIRTT